MLNTLVQHLQSVASIIREETTAVVNSGDHIAIIKHFNDVRIAAELAKEAREALNDISDQLSREFVPNALRSKDIKTITVEGVGRVTVSHRFSCSMLDKDKGIKWLQDNGHGGLVQLTVNSSTLAAFARNLIEEEGKELPDDLFKVGATTYTSITKVK